MLEACVTDKVDSKLFSFVKNKKTIIGKIVSGLTRKAAKKYADIEEEELAEIYAIACDLTVLKNTVIVRWALLSGAGLGDYLNGRTVEHC